VNVTRKALIPLQLATLAGLATVGLAGAGTAHAAGPTATPAAVAAHKCGKNPAKNLHLSRAAILKRGRSWVSAKVPYSQIGTYCNGYGRYRRDCSGFVSMAWGLHTSYWTGTLIGSKVSKPVSIKKLAAGDALTHHPKSQKKGHVALVVSKDKKGVNVYAEPYTGSYAQKQHWSWKYIKDNHYYGIHYKNVK
jgi:hypothetical protein